MHPSSLPSPFREALSTQEILQRLGFRAHEIAVAHEDERLAVVLQTQGREFAIPVGRTRLDDKAFDKEWTLAVGAYNVGGDATWQPAMERARNKAEKMLPALLVELRQNGILAPKVAN